MVKDRNTPRWLKLKPMFFCCLERRGCVGLLIMDELVGLCLVCKFDGGEW